MKSEAARDGAAARMESASRAGAPVAVQAESEATSALRGVSAISGQAASVVYQQQHAQVDHCQYWKLWRCLGGPGRCEKVTESSCSSQQQPAAASRQYGYSTQHAALLSRSSGSLCRIHFSPLVAFLAAFLPVMRRAEAVVRRSLPRRGYGPATRSSLSPAPHSPPLLTHSSASHHVTSSSASPNNCLSVPPVSSLSRPLQSYSTSATSRAPSVSSFAGRQDITSCLKEKSLFREGSYLCGSWLSSSSASSAIPVLNPSTAAVIGHIPAVTAEQLHSAVLASYEAQKGWAAKTATERAAVLRRWFGLMQQHELDLGAIMTCEQGKPHREAVGEIAYAAGFLEVYASEATRQFGDIIPSPSPHSRILVTYQPVGVVAAITPWNFPAAMITRKVGAAIAAGCTVLLKPSELTPFTALALCELALRAGLPPNVFQVVTGDASVLGPILSSHELIRKLTFTGSTRLGKMLMAQCATTVKRTSMELGGNAPLIVFDDADVQEAVRGIMASKFRNCGQTCVTSNRIYVHQAVMDEVVRAVHAEIGRLQVGDGMADGSVVGPLINEAAVEKCERHIQDALQKGARLVYGGKRLTAADSPLIPTQASKLYFSPTLVVDTPTSSAAFEEETFGPVAFIFPFSTEAEVLQSANNTRAGLAAYVYTRDIKRVARVVSALEYGMIGVNQGSVSVPTAPFGGMKESGYGREGSHYGLHDYLDMKTLHMAV